LKGVASTSDNFDLYEYLGDSWAVVFMHPADFTPVCTTELGKAALLKGEFAKRGVKLCAFSCSGKEAHAGWIEDIKKVTGGVVDFPIYCDPSREAAVELGIVDKTNKDSAGLPLTVRSVFVLNPSRTITLMMTYPASTGRNFDEILRVVDSVKLTADKAVATPADWKQGEDVIVNFPLTNAMADEKFGKDGYRVVDVPSEAGKNLPKNYLRYTKDPSA
jgi:alkyl hydroperoxide reductase subunit AhpC